MILEDGFQEWPMSCRGLVGQRGEELRQRRLPHDLHGQKDLPSSFVAVLKACARDKNLCKGTRIHDEILRHGLLEKCSDALVVMYVQCGAVEEAKELLDVYKSPEVFIWTILIAGLCQRGQGQYALKYFEAMQHEGLSPDPVTFTCALKACGSIQALEKGVRIHNAIAKQGLPQNNVVLGNALVDMYAKCGALMKAREVLEQLPVRNVISWTTLIAAYAQQDEGAQALDCFERMQCEGLYPNAVTFICVLKAISSIRAIAKGDKVYKEIAKQGLLVNNVALGNALVDMYTKCGDLSKAQELLEELPTRNVVSWNTLIAGFAQQGESEQAFSCFERMQHEGISPDGVTLTCMLKACGSFGALEKGEKIHGKISKQGLLQNDIVLGNALADMYAKSGSLAKALRVLDELPFRDVTSWNTVLVGYVQHGEANKALTCFEKLQHEGLSPDVGTYSCILKACGSIKALDKGEEFHDEITKHGFLGSNVVLCTALVDMYVKCGALEKARKALEQTPARDVICWNALIAGYAACNEGEEILTCFARMQHEGVFPDSLTFKCILKACGSMAAADDGKKVHGEIIKQELLSKDIALGIGVMDMYGKCGMPAKARLVLEELPTPNVIAWCKGQRENIISFLKACASIGAADKGGKVCDEIMEDDCFRDDLELGVAFVEMYAKCGHFVKALRVLDDLSGRDIVPWNALISGYVQHDETEEALDCLEKMQWEGLSPDSVTLACILNACGSMRAADKGKAMHNEIAKYGLFESDVVLGTSVVDMYTKCHALAKAQAVLEELPVRDVVSWNALIAGYARESESAQAFTCFEQMQREGLSPDLVTFTCILKACGSIGAVHKGERIHNEIAKQGLLMVLGNALLDMYVKCGALTKARQVLEEIPSRNVISWTTLIAGYSEHGEGEQALSCFEQMQHEGLPPNAVTFISILRACGSIGAEDMGERIHDKIVVQNLIKDNVELGNALVSMYAKSGCLRKAREVLEGLPLWNSLSWNALIAGCAQQGEGALALNYLQEMEIEGLSPDAVTFSSMLSVYSHVGRIEDARVLFMNMSSKYGMEPDSEHYACIVDLLGRSGYVHKAVGAVERMSSCDRGAWSALMGACGKWENVYSGKWAFDHAVQVHKNGDAALYSQMATIYAAAGINEYMDSAASSIFEKKAWKSPMQTTGA